MILVLAACLAFSLGQHTDALIILTIVLGSGLLGFWQHRGAAEAMDALLARVRIKAMVLRDGEEIEVPLEAVVPGDVAVVNAGDLTPGDCLILESKDLYVDEASMTGETYPVEKAPCPRPPSEETPLGQRSNNLFLGTHVVSGTARAIVARAGAATEFSQVSQRMALGRPETEFERGVRRFGYLLMEVTLILVIAIFAINVALARPVLDSFLFSLALDALARGIREGRATFANTLKYIYMATSANFGNMFSMAGVSLILPYLPLLPKQVLLVNLLTDLPEMAIASDHVDPG